MTVKYETGSERIALDKNNIADDFFILSSGMAGEVLQNGSIIISKQPFMATFPVIPASRCMILFMSLTRVGIFFHGYEAGSC